MSELKRNKETVRRFVEAFNEHDRDALVECSIEQCVEHTSQGNRRILDYETHWQDCLAFYGIFPDIQVSIDNMIAEGDRVFLRQTLSGTHEGKTDRSRFEPTGKKATWSYWAEYRLEDGRIAEVWTLGDSFHQYEQLGLLELPKRNSSEKG